MKAGNIHDAIHKNACTSEQYAATADELTRRIMALIPSNPQILDMSNPWDLFDISGFECSDIGPSLYQAGWSMRMAQQLYREEG